MIRLKRIAGELRKTAPVSLRVNPDLDAKTHPYIATGLKENEPGSSLTGNTGILLARVEYLKHGAHRNFAVPDAAINDLMRPALYDA